MTQPFRFGVQLTGAADGPAWRAKARQVEDLGYSTLFIPDHFGEQWGPIVAMTIAAEATTALNVGALVFDNDYRHPIVLAKEMATLDLATDGRVEFGLGAGWMTTDYEQSGIAHDPAPVRIDRMVEAIAIYKECWAPTGAALEGAHYSVHDVVGKPEPRSKPGPKLIIGGGGKRVLSIAAREADIIGVNPNLAAGAIGPEVLESAGGGFYRERLGWIKDAAGERFDSLELQCLTFAVNITPDGKTILEGLASGMGINPDDARKMPLVLIGSVDEICDLLQQRREEYGLSYIVVHDPELEAFAEIVARLSGT